MSPFMLNEEASPETQSREGSSQSEAQGQQSQNRPMSAAHALKTIDPAKTAFANRLSALLQPGTAGEDPDSPSVQPHSLKIIQTLSYPSNPPVFSDDGGRYFQPLVAADGPINVHEEDIDGLIAVLDQFEPLLQIFEQRSGHALEPASVANQWPADTIWIELACAGAWTGAARFGFAPPLQQIENLPQPSVIKELQQSPVAVELVLRGPSLALSDADNLESGDILLLDAGLLAAKLIADPDYSGKAQTSEGLWDTLSGHFRLSGSTRPGAPLNPNPPEKDEQGTPSMSDDVAPNPTSQNSEATTKSFQVPIHICLRNIAVPADTLASLTEGATLDLMPLREGLQVDLHVAGQTIGGGEIVKLGDNFAVLMDHVAGTKPQPDPAAAEDEAANTSETTSDSHATPTGETA